MCLRVMFVSLLQEQPLFVTAMMPRLLEQTRNEDWEGSEHEKRPRLMAMLKLSSIAMASAQPMLKWSLDSCKSPVTTSKLPICLLLLCQY